jgi:hypothetical protein
LFAAGDEEPGGEDGARSWERLKQGEIGMVVSALRDGVITGLDRLPRDAELADKGLDEPGMRSKHALIGGQGDGRLDRVEALDDQGR